LALSTTPWIQSNIVDKFMKKKEEEAQTTTSMTSGDETKTNGDA
jgi:hypothetical protein